MIFILVLLTAFIVVLALWIVGFLFQNDFSIHKQDIKKIKRVLIMFPHADDEVSSGGLIRRLAKQSSHVTLAILTKGEKGNPDAHFDQNLKEIRTKEASEVSKLFKANELVQEDFGDGELANKRVMIEDYISDLLKKTNPDLVITYDLAGMYGHEDHIVCSEITTGLVQKMAGTSLWYISLPKRVLAMASLPEHMAKDPNFRDRRAFPDIKVFVGLDVLSKIQAVYIYKSQGQSFRSAVPFNLPFWFIYSMQVFEYFKKVR
jgi:LmbE family N-acetylglucosaminyl deacetylase